MSATALIDDPAAGLDVLTDDEASGFLAEACNLPTTTDELAALRALPGSGPRYHRTPGGLIRYKPRDLVAWALTQLGESVA
jgi:hypothetical protein